MVSTSSQLQSDRKDENPFADLLKLQEKLQNDQTEAAKKDFRDEKLKDAMNYRNMLAHNYRSEKVADKFEKLDTPKFENYDSKALYKPL